MSARSQRKPGTLPPVTNESRGEAIKGRRLDQGYETPTAFAKATGKDWETIERAEAGKARPSTYDFLEQWLAREEAEAAMPVGGTPDETAALKVELHGIYSEGGIRIDDIIASGGDPDEIAEMVGKIFDRLKQGDVS